MSQHLALQSTFRAVADRLPGSDLRASHWQQSPFTLPLAPSVPIITMVAREVPPARCSFHPDLEVDVTEGGPLV
jgi:hypothetical protein